VRTFSIGFADRRYDETRYAELVACKLGTEHETHCVEARAWETLPGLAWHFDEPFADSSALPTWHVARVTRCAVTVALAGDAGDELFGGYERYRALALMELLQVLGPGVCRLVRRTCGVLSGSAAPPKSFRRRLSRLLENGDGSSLERYLGWMTTFDVPARERLYSSDQAGSLVAARESAPAPVSAAELLRLAFAQAESRDSATQAMIADLLTYLPGDLLVKVDIATMAHGLECRAPFLDHRVVELAAAMSVKRKLKPIAGRSKLILKEAFGELLPREILLRGKMGFAAPISSWLRNELRNELREVLLDRACLDRGLFRASEVERLVCEHASATGEHGQRLWALLMLELWYRRHVDGRC
jgi:asparagine synthase (glutamine-hydrolysing)